MVLGESYHRMIDVAFPISVVRWALGQNQVYGNGTSSIPEYSRGISHPPVAPSIFGIYKDQGLCFFI